jgi:WD40 repeat protein
VEHQTGEVQAEGDFGTTLRSLAFSPKGKTLAAAGDVPALSLWDAATGERIQTSSKHIDRIFAVAFRPDGQTLATGSWDKSVILWDFSESMPAPPPTSQPVAGK